MPASVGGEGRGGYSAVWAMHDRAQDAIEYGRRLEVKLSQPTPVALEPERHDTAGGAADPRAGTALRSSSRSVRFGRLGRRHRAEEEQMKRRTVALATIALVVAACTSAASPSTPSPTVPYPSVTTTMATSTSAPSTSTGPTPLPAGPDVSLAGLTDPAHGWAVSAHRLLVTSDGGAAWRDSTPPGGFATADADRLLVKASLAPSTAGSRSTRPSRAGVMPPTAGSTSGARAMAAGRGRMSLASVKGPASRHEHGTTSAVR